MAAKKTTKRVRSKIAAISRTIDLVIHRECQNLTPEEYGHVLAEVSAEIEGRLDALKEERGAAWYDENVMSW